ncbi:hypothetical protein [Propionivibrio sp.]|uniref:hypothetical protein n=1 Tax=Propionivibrio sp. TaxID=2212460 RepID=UPI0039E4E4A9
MLYTLAGCVVYHVGVWAMLKLSLAAVSSEVVHSKAAVCRLDINTLCYSSHLAIYLLFALFFAWGAVVAWQDLISGRRAPDSNGRGLSSLFRSAWLVRQSWFVLPVLALLLLAITIKELL